MIQHTLIDVLGQSFGRLTVVARAERPKSSNRTNAYWLCSCSCGRQTIVTGQDL
jgi:hypothetical protein